MGGRRVARRAPVALQVVVGARPAGAGASGGARREPRGVERPRHEVAYVLHVRLGGRRRADPGRGRGRRRRSPRARRTPRLPCCPGVPRPPAGRGRRGPRSSPAPDAGCAPPRRCCDGCSRRPGTATPDGGCCAPRPSASSMASRSAAVRRSAASSASRRSMVTRNSKMSSSSSLCSVIHWTQHFCRVRQVAHPRPAVGAAGGHQIAGALERAEGDAEGDARDAEFRGELRGRREPVARPQLAPEDERADVAFRAFARGPRREGHVVEPVVVHAALSRRMMRRL